MPPDDDTISPSLSRRAAVQAGALTAAALAFGLPGVRGASTEQEADALARIYASDFHPDARFEVVSNPLDYTPETPIQEGEAFLVDRYWRGYETRVIRYGNTNERVLFFVPESADVEPGQTYETGEIRSTDELAEGIVGVTFV
ncbi:hypothetical protein [Halobacterium zhouii]|uniref:hypothetical protein n=1 Tax=Halobacterium zhouii TaxID=2902624 RepID=UPI001E3F1B13|nr:hypothetical protein [Halobacterium zhouii]